MNTLSISSAGLRIILRATKIVKRAGHHLTRAGLLPQVLEIFTVSGFSAPVNIAQDRAAAPRKGWA